MEKTIVKKIMRHLEGMGYFCIKIHGGEFQVAGLPDLLCIIAGSAAWIEVKQPGGKPTKLQVAMLARLRKAGCRAGVATTIDEALEVIGECQTATI